MIKYCFSSDDGEVYFKLPVSVSSDTILSLMKDCNFHSCYVKVKSNVYRLKIAFYE